MLTTYDTDEAIEAGASGYFLEDAPPDTLLDAVPADIRPLAEHFLEKACTKYGRDGVELAADARAARARES